MGTGQAVLEARGMIDQDGLPKEPSRINVLVFINAKDEDEARRIVLSICAKTTAKWHYNQNMVEAEICDYDVVCSLPCVLLENYLNPGKIIKTMFHFPTENEIMEINAYIIEEISVYVKASLDK